MFAIKRVGSLGVISRWAASALGAVCGLFVVVVFTAMLMV